jgi:hypothetical protein
MRPELGSSRRMCRSTERDVCGSVLAEGVTSLFLGSQR